MWRPRSYDEMRAALGTAEESDALDFKSALATNNDKKDLGKDAAAMALYGGCIVIGVDETDGVASQLTPVPLSGTTEQIAQVIASRVSPPLAVAIEVLRDDPADTEGLIVIEVPASAAAPHQADGRYPARAGSTTRALAEIEVEQWYRRRTEFREQLMSGDMSAWVNPTGLDTGWGGIGRMRLLARAPGAGRHPATPRMGSALAGAADAATRRCEELLRQDLNPPHALSFLREWSPRGSMGWRAGMAAREFEEARRGVLVAASWTYSGAFSSLTTIGLEIEGTQARCAYEHLWVTNLIAQLLMVGTLMRKVPAAGSVSVSLDLSGLDGSRSFEASRGRLVDEGAPVVTDTTYSAHGVFDAMTLAEDPRSAVRELLEPLLASFVERDTVGWVSAPPTS